VQSLEENDFEVPVDFEQDAIKNRPRIKKIFFIYKKV
jgi:hypothetical protein